MIFGCTASRVVVYYTAGNDVRRNNIMGFYFKTEGAKIHLYRENGLFDDDLGELKKL